MSLECLLPQLNPFEVIPKQHSIEKTEQISVKPLASIENARIIQFSKKGDGDLYTNLKSMYLHLRVKMIHLKADGTAEKTTPAKADLNVFPVNNLLHSLFRQVTLSLNGQQVAQNSQNYPYRAYIENLLNFEADSAMQHLYPVCWKTDTAKYFDDLTNNSNGRDRGLLFPVNEEIDLYGNLALDLMGTKKYFLNNVNIDLTLELAPSNFYLMRTKDNLSQLKILDATLFMNVLTINPEIMLKHQTQLKTYKVATYPYKRAELRNFTIGTGSTSFQIDNVCNGILPDFVLIVMVDNLAYQGDETLNPFNFQHFNISSFNASVNGIEIAPRHMDFNFSQTNPRSQHAYFNLFNQENIRKFDRANQITPDLFNNGAFILAYDLSTDRDNLCESRHKTGSLRFDAKFKTAIQKTITVIAYLQYSARLHIDSERNVYPQMF